MNYRLKRLFCRHKFKYYMWYEDYDEFKHERFSARIYKCTKCGKRILVDGRNDPYFK